jgi:hypothetical protein
VNVNNEEMAAFVATFTQYCNEADAIVSQTTLAHYEAATAASSEEPVDTATASVTLTDQVHDEAGVETTAAESEQENADAAKMIDWLFYKHALNQHVLASGILETPTTTDETGCDDDEPKQTLKEAETETDVPEPEKSESVTETEDEDDSISSMVSLRVTLQASRTGWRQFSRDVISSMIGTLIAVIVMVVAVAVMRSD